MKKPIIGITLDEEKSGYYSKFPWYAIRKNYIHSILKYGGIPYPLFYSSTNIKDIFSLVDGIIITGGNFDIDTSLYNKKNNFSRNIKNRRTKFEMKICKICIENNIPILGICGGEQLLNVSCGGTLIQDIKKKKIIKINHEQKNPRNRTSHYVNINIESKANFKANPYARPSKPELSETEANKSTKQENNVSETTPELACGAFETKSLLESDRNRKLM